MATFGTSVRRGLPRRPGGEPWPPAGDAPAEASAAVTPEPAAAVAPVAAPAVAVAPVAESAAAPAPVAESAATSPVVESAAPSPVVERAQRDETPAPEQPAAAASVAAAPGRSIRRGLPRVSGGEPWPPAAAAPVVRVAQTAATGATSPQNVTPEPRGAATAAAEVAQDAASAASTAQNVTPEGAARSGEGAKALRRGLPRVPGGEPWPPAGFAPTVAAAPSPDSAPAHAPQPTVASAPSMAPTTTQAPDPSSVASTDAAAPAAAAAQTRAAAEDEASIAPSSAVTTAPATPSGVPPSQPLPFTRTVWASANARTRPVPKAEPKRVGPFTRLQWAGIVIVGGGALLYAAAMAVLAVRWLLSTQWGVDFLAQYPGEYHLPEGAPVGFPAWLGWQHFFNVFLMVLIIRTGLQVRTEKRPTVFWSPRSNGRRKISLNLWFHQSLDILWLVNGVIFVVLLFVTGQWMRIVPTSWEVFPNAVSAGLQYVSLDWPTENGWVNYNSLQQLAYFATVFLAAPLAALTGVRMSGIWPKNAAGLNKAYPVEWARAVHFPVMLYFVAFIAVHVFLVFATGALRNLNHMYAASDAVNWVGFWLFVASIVVIAAAWVAARPLVLAPIARLFGKVSGR